MDSTKSCIPRCVHSVMNVPDKDGKNRVCSLCSPIPVPANARYVIARNADGRFQNIADPDALAAG
jgi:hypothetical protein